MSSSEMLRRFIDTLEEGARLRRMDYGAVNTASLGKRRRPPGSGWDSAAPPTMPRTGGRPPPRDDDEDAFLDDDERERRDAMREMGRWSEDQLRDFLDIKGESHGNLRTHAELLRTAVDAETGAVGNDTVAPATTANDAAGSDDEDDPFEAFMAGINDEVKAAPAPKPLGSTKPTRSHLECDDDDDPIMSFVEARRRGQTSVAGTRGSAAGGAGPSAAHPIAVSGVEDEDVYAAAAAADAGADVGGARDGRPGASEPLPRIDHASIEYEDFNADFYNEAPEISSMDAGDVEARRRQLDVHVVGVDPPNPVTRFGQCGGLGASTLKVLKRIGYDAPTAIQAQAIPALLSGRDVLGIAKTGSGKTASFALPALVHAMDQRTLRRGDGPIVLVLAPVRELAAQILSEFRRFAKAHEGLRCVGVLGGGSKTDNFRELRNGAEVVVGTPGRLVDVCRGGNKAATNLRRVTYLVLDEADRMLDMGFEAQVRSICDGCRPDRQTALFSATMPARVRALCDDVMGSDALTITVGRPGGANADVAQFAEVLPDGSDDARLAWLVQRARQFVDEGEVLVFVSRRAHVETCEAALRDVGIRVKGLHGDMHQSDRAAALGAFRKGEAHVLVATDVAARGLDVPSVRTVVSLHVPRDIESHVHRIGRTGRAGAVDGKAFTLVSNTDSKRFLGELVLNMQRAGQGVSPELHALAGRQGRVRGRGGGWVGGKKGKLGLGGTGVGFGGDDLTLVDELTRGYDARKAGEAAAAAGDLPPPPPPPPGGAVPSTAVHIPPVHVPKGFVPSTDGALFSRPSAASAPPPPPPMTVHIPPPPPPTTGAAAIAARAAAVAAKINAQFAAQSQSQPPVQSGSLPDGPASHQLPGYDADTTWRAPGVGRGRPTVYGFSGGSSASYNAVPPPANVTTNAPGRGATRPAPAPAMIDPSVDPEAAARMAKARAFAMSQGFSGPMPAASGGAGGGMNPAAAAAARAAAAAIAAKINAQANGHRLE